jgi:hypothetical protein
LNDERLFGIHLWTARNDVARAAKRWRWARCWPTDRPRRPLQHRQNRYTGNRQCYARIYDRLLADKRRCGG